LGGIAGLHGDALKVRVAAPALGNKANAALAALLGDLLEVPAASLSIRLGAKGRCKVVAIGDADAALAARLQALIAALSR